MAISYTWKINQMYTVPNVTNMPDYVVNVLWELDGNDGAGHTASIQGNTQFTVDPSQTGYIAYSSLTEPTVIGWVQTALGPQGIANYEANINGQIQSQINPPVSPSNTALPW